MENRQMFCCISSSAYEPKYYSPLEYLVAETVTRRFLSELSSTPCSSVVLPMCFLMAEVGLQGGTFLNNSLYLFILRNTAML